MTVENGIPVYYDAVNKPGSSFVTNAGYGTQVIWKLDPKSGLNEITDVTLNGDLFMLAEKPRKLSADTWVAKVGNTGEGEVSFSVAVRGNAVYQINSQLNGQLKASGAQPIIRVP